MNKYLLAAAFLLACMPAKGREPTLLEDRFGLPVWQTGPKDRALWWTWRVLFEDKTIHEILFPSDASEDCLNLRAVPETARRDHGNVKHIWCGANVLPYCGDLHWLGIGAEITAEIRRIGEFNQRTIDPPKGFRCGTSKIAKETQQGQLIALGAYSNYGFSNCIPQEPPEVSVVKKPVHGEVVITHGTHPVKKPECEGKPANFSIV